MTFEEVWPIINNIPGWLHDKDARTLFDLVSNLSGERTIIEVGTFCGRSAVLLALASQHKVICIDPMVIGPDDANHMTVTEMDVLTLEENIRKYPQIEWMRLRSCDVDLHPVDGCVFKPACMIYIDANHQYPSPREDYLAFHEYLSPGAVVAFHDWGKTFPGVKQSIQELEQEGYIFNGRPCGSLYIANRCK